MKKTTLFSGHLSFATQRTLVFHILAYVCSTITYLAKGISIEIQHHCTVVVHKSPDTQLRSTVVTQSITSVTQGKLTSQVPQSFTKASALSTNAHFGGKVDKSH